jgi:hypothetical protein
MPRPRTAQAAARPAALEANDSNTSPAANITLVAASTSRPPCLSIMRPASGPSRPESNNAAEKMPKNQTFGRPSANEIGSAKTAFR